MRNAMRSELPAAGFRGDPIAAFQSVRAQTLALAEPLELEDWGVQSMPDASPVKWHVAHTTWFFETFVLRPHAADYRPLDERYGLVFNSYYLGVGDTHPRDRRGLLTRPTIPQVLAYRAHVDVAVAELLEHAAPEVLDLVELGLHHEQQHQELVLTDLLHAFGCNPLRPAYREPRFHAPVQPALATSQPWVSFDGGLVDIGHTGEGFAYDNESPSHRVWLAPFAIAARPVTCAEYLAFIEDGGYQRPELWMSAGWDAVRSAGWDAPLYWQDQGDRWIEFTLVGTRELDLLAPVSHISWFEADAYARWAGALGWIIAGVTLFGSVALGWHYAVDGYASIVGMVGLWWLAGRIVARYGNSA